MTITAIKYQVKNPERVSLFIDGKYAFSLSVSQIVSLSLKPGITLQNDALSELKELSVDGRLRTRALNWITLRPRSVYETKQYLYRISRNIEGMTRERLKKNSESIIDECLERGWLSDLRFAEWWVERHTSERKGNCQIEGELRTKGIQPETIRAVLKSRNDQHALLELIKKLKMKPKYRDKDKLMRYLAGKGFGYSSITEALAAAEAEGVS